MARLFYSSNRTADSYFWEADACWEKRAAIPRDIRSYAPWRASRHEGTSGP